MDKSVDSLPSLAEESLVVPTPPPVKEELIKINLPQFEGFLNSIKEQLSKHDKQLESPTWLDDLKRESDKITALARRLEHTQLDVNTIKDFIYYPPTNGTKEKQRKDPMLLLQADVESLKLVARRIDLYQSEDLNVYVQLKKLQKDYYDLLKMIEKLDKDSVINAMKIDFNNKITNMNNRIDEITEAVEENRHTLDDKIEEVHQTVDIEMKEKIKEVQDQINAFLSDGEEEEEEGERGDDEGGSDKDPTETQDTFLDTVDTADILKPSQMMSSPGERRSSNSSSGNRESGVSFAGLGGYDEVKTMGTEENNTSSSSSSRKSARKSSAIPEDTEVSHSDDVAATSSSTPSRLRKASSSTNYSDSAESEEGESPSLRRNTISNALPGIKGAAIPATSSPAVVRQQRATMQGGIAARDIARGTMMSLGGFGASSASSAAAAGGGGGGAGGRKSTAKGGKFCTLDKFLILVEEVDSLKNSLGMNIFKLRAHGVSRLQQVFTKWQTREAALNKKRAFAKLHLNMQYLGENAQKRYKELTIKTDYIIERAFGRIQIRGYFERWRTQTERLQTGQRLFFYSRDIMKYWLERVKPDLKKYLNIWKNFAVESFRKFVYTGLDDTEAPPYDEFQHMLNGTFNMKAMQRIAHKDLLRRMAMREAKLKATTPQVAYMKDEEAEARTQEALDGLGKKLEESEEEARVLRRDVLRLFALLEGQKQDMTARIDKEATVIMGTINNFKSKVTTQLTHTGDLIEMNQKRTDTNFSLHADISDTLRLRIQDAERDLKFHEETQDSIINSQKSIRVEMDELLMKQEYIDSKFKQVSNEIMLNARAMTTGIEEVRRVEKEYKDITTYYDSELKSMKSHSNAIESKLAESIKTTDEKTNLLELKSDLLAANQDEVFPQKPQAYFVYKICQAYEKVMMRIHAEGGVNLLNKHIEEDLKQISEDMAIEATRIAHSVVTAADRIVSHRLMESLLLQSASPANLELEQHPSNQNITPAMTFAALGANHGVHNNHNTSVKHIPVAVQVIQEREALLNEFLTQFVNILKEKDPHPGFVRGNARIVFHAKLKLTTEVLISKSHCMFNLLDTHQSSLTKRQYSGDSAVVGATLGETFSSEACVACNRPMSATVGGGGGGGGSGPSSRPASALNRPSSASNNNNNNCKSNQETAATIVQLQQQLAHITSSLNKLKLLDPMDGPSLKLTGGSTTGMLRPHSATVLGSVRHTNIIAAAAAAVGAKDMVGVAITDSEGHATVETQPKLKRKGTFHAGHGGSNQEEDGVDDDLLLEDLYMVDREHHTHLNTRRNSNSNLNYTRPPETTSPSQQMMTSSLSHSRSSSPPLGGSAPGGNTGLANEHAAFYHHQNAQHPSAVSSAYDEIDFDSEGFHQYLDKPYNVNQKKSMPTSSGAVRHREAVHKSHAMLLTTQGGGFKTSPAMSQEEMVQQLTASFQADISMPRDVNQDRSDLLFTESENMLREIQHHALNDEEGLRSALIEEYRGQGHSPSGMVLSQSDSHLLGSRRLVGTNKTKKLGNATISFD